MCLTKDDGTFVQKWLLARLAEGSGRVEEAERLFSNASSKDTCNQSWWDSLSTQTHQSKEVLEMKERYLLKWERKETTCLLFTWFF